MNAEIVILYVVDNKEQTIPVRVRNTLNVIERRILYLTGMGIFVELSAFLCKITKICLESKMESAPYAAE
jgi:hypothetical protein